MKLSLLLVALFSINSFSEEFKIYDIIEPINPSDKYLVLVENGEVLEFNSSNKSAIDDLYWAKSNNVNVDFFIDTNNEKNLDIRRTTSNFRLLNSEYKNISESLLDPKIPTPRDNYRFTTLRSLDEAQYIFDRMTKRTRKRSQCYNRAHVWIYDANRAYARSGRELNMGKMWLFFTRKYIRQYRYKWWFHIAPYALVRGEREETVLDRKFLRGPVGTRTWTNFFMKNKAECKVVEYYSDYRNHQQDEHCYLIKSSMYYYQPYQIERLETGSPERTKFLSWEIRQARRDALR